MFEVYGEYLFLENLLMNWLILYLTATFSRFKVSKARLWIGAAVGALYAFVVFFPSLSFLYSTMMKFLASMLIIIITFIPYHFKDFLKQLAIFYLISFMFGGAAFALFYFTDFNGLVSNGVFYIANFPIRLLLYSGIVSYILLKFCWEYIQVKISRNKVYIPIWVAVGEQKSKICALIDTGNSLQEPLSKYPVIIVEYSAIKELLPENIRYYFDRSQEVNLDLLSNILQTSDWMNRFRVIPFKSLGKENGMLIGFKPDSVILEEKNEVRRITNIIIGIYTKELSSNGDYRALLHPDILT